MTAYLRFLTLVRQAVELHNASLTRLEHQRLSSPVAVWATLLS
jgi:hypothetical protein